MEASEKRADDRRRTERRRFRSEPGRRDPSAKPRRKGDRRRPRLSRFFVLLLLLTLGGFAYRAVVVAPARGARVEADSVGKVADKVLRGLSLPLLAAPAFGPPREGDPVEGPGISTEARGSFEALAERLESASSSAPREVAPYLWEGPIRLALGDERGARIAWQQVLALGSEEEQEAARVGIAVVQIRVGLRSVGEQDRRFALEAALHMLGPVERGSVHWPHRLVAEALAQLAMEDDDAADAVLAEMLNARGPVVDGALPGLEARRSGEEPVSASLAARLDQPPDPE